MIPKKGNETEIIVFVPKNSNDPKCIVIHKKITIQLKRFKPILKFKFKK
jgi:hypothetical protein